MIVMLLFDYRELQVPQVRLERLVLQVRRERRETKESQVLRGGPGSKETRVPLDPLEQEETLGLLYVVKDMIHTLSLPVLSITVCFTLQPSHATYIL